MTAAELNTLAADAESLLIRLNEALAAKRDESAAAHAAWVSSGGAAAIAGQTRRAVAAMGAQV